MPELPEVEALRRDLAPHLIGREIAGVEVRLPKIIRPPGGLPPEIVVGRRITGLRRRAKTLIWDLTGDLAIVVHLKLTGQLVLEDANGARLAQGGHPVPRFDTPMPHKATHVIFHFADAGRLYFTDIRQFANLRFLPAEAVADHLTDRKLGPEPLEDDYTRSVFEQSLARRSRAQLKPLLLDQGFVSGLGNIYADEALHAARLHPLRRAGDLTRAERKRLYEAIRAVLTLAVTEGIADFESSEALEARGFPRVHGRANRPCHTCDRPITRIKVGTRSTYFCPRCQKPSRASRVPRPE